MSKFIRQVEKEKKIINSKTFFSRYYTNVKIKIDLAPVIAYDYAIDMYMTDYFIVFPEGDTQEIHNRLSLNQLVDVNGNPLVLPLPTNRMVVFRVAKISANEYKGGSETYHYLEQLSARELLEYVEG